ncbi:MAG: four helix bundle protein [Xenococcaceae cyanobacterium]
MTMVTVRSFKDLRLWQNSIDLAMKIYELTQSFPIEERYFLTDQIRLSSRFVAINIAESWCKRRYPSIFVSKLNDAESKAAETQTWIEIAHRCGYLNKDDAVDLEKRCEDIIGQLVAMISHPEKWTVNSSFWSSRS